MNVSRATPLGLFVALLVSCATCARDLPAIDRLADAPARPDTATMAAAARQVAADAHIHSRLGVPTFVWAARDATSAAGAMAGGGSDIASIARGHLANLRALYALGDADVDSLTARYVHALPNGAAIVKFGHAIDGVEVFREEAAVVVDADRRLVAIGGFVSGGAASGAFADVPEFAVAAALGDWSFDASIRGQLTADGTRDGYAYFTLPEGTASRDGSTLRSPARTKPVLFRLPNRLVPAYYVEVEMNDGTAPGVIDRYAYVVSATGGEVLFRHNQTADAAFSYRVFAEAGGNNLPLPSPSGRNGFPHPTATPDGYQGPFVPPNLVTLANAPFSRNDPWLPAGATVTTGNNVDAFADLASPDGFSAGDVRAAVSSPGAFDYTFDPAQGPGASSAQIMAAVTNLFFVNNWLHDWYYDAGFNEAAGNAQTDNFGRGGAGGDSIIAEGQDFNARNNANMATPADGGRPRMRMYVFDAVQFFQNAITAPAAIAGVKQSAGATFGPRAFNVTASVVNEPSNGALSGNINGCLSVTGAAAGKIALIDRGGCSFKTKVRNAQNAGAAGVIVANNTTGVSTMGDDATIVTPITIPSVMFTQLDGNAIKAQLAAPTAVTASLSSAIGPDRDGTVDNSIIIHEWGHYLSNRLVANSSGLTTNQSRGMGEGWSDFNALLVLVKGSDATLPADANFNGTYAEGAYVTGGPPDPGNNGYYYGFRRYPYSRDMTKNPLTLKHVANGVALPASPAPAFGADGASNSEVHNTGEVWASMLWECYSNLLNDTARLTFAQAQDRMKRYLVAGLELTPSTPTIVEARDALLAAIAAQDSADYALCFQGFAKRGAGAGAVAADRFSADNGGVVESFTAGAALVFVSVAVSDSANYCDADGFLDNGESGTLTVTIRNTGSTMLTATTGSVSSGNAHLAFPSGHALTFPATLPGQVASASIPVQLAGAAGVESASLTLTLDDPTLSIPRPVDASGAVWLNADAKPNASATDTVETAHSAWTAGTTSTNPVASLRWQRAANSGADHYWHGPDAGIAQLAWLQSPPLLVAAAGSFTFTFRHRHSFEFDASGDYDGGQVQITADGGATWTSIGAFLSPTYNGTVTNYTGDINPVAGQAAYIRTSAGYPAMQTVTANLGTAYAGKTVMIRFAIGSDASGPAAGWDIDDIAFANITNTPFDALVTHAGACVSVVASSGTPQTAQVNGLFPSPLKALVKDAGGLPVAGATVTFTAPGAGASATFGGNATVVTDATGIAASPQLTANGTAGGYTIVAHAGLQSTSFALTNSLAAPPTIDVDGNAAYDALTDGLLLVRYLFGLSGPSLVTGAIGSGAARTSPTDILAYLDAMRPYLDIDGDGQEDALTDGLLLIRYLFGLRGAQLVANAVSPGATRATAAAIETYLQSLLPP